MAEQCVVNTPEQACQAQALASIAREWPNVLHASFEIVLRGNRCLVYLYAPAMFVTLSPRKS